MSDTTSTVVPNDMLDAVEAFSSPAAADGAGLSHSRMHSESPSMLLQELRFIGVSMPALQTAVQWGESRHDHNPRQHL